MLQLDCIDLNQSPLSLSCPKSFNLASIHVLFEVDAC